MALKPYEFLTTEWLTGRLAATTALQNSQVTGIEFSSDTYNHGFMAEITKQNVTCSKGATGSLLRNLILKYSKDNLHHELADRSTHEAEFFQITSKHHLDLPLPTCLSVEFDPDRHMSETLGAYILMEDLTETHFQKLLPIPPSNHHCEMIVESLARLHATGWNNPLLGQVIGERLDLSKAEAMDPAFFITLHWNPQRRALLELPLLKRYHQELVSWGVEFYSWEDFWNDYHQAVILASLIPIGQFRRNSPAGVVWFGLQDSLVAFEDLDCAELL